MESPILADVVLQHLDEAAWLWTMRKPALRAPQRKLQDLVSFDERIEAHLDGLLIAGEAVWRLCEAQLDAGPGEMFAAAVLALRLGEGQRLRHLLALAEAAPALQPGLIAALDWVQNQQLPEPAELLTAPSSFQRWLGIRCAILQRNHPGPGPRTDIGSVLSTGIHDPDEGIRSRSLRAAGELGLRDLLWSCQQYFSAAEDSCRFWAAWSAALLGDRARSLQILWPFCTAANPFQERALQLAMLALNPGEVHALLKSLEQDLAGQRLLVQSVGRAGNPERVPWLIEQMQVPSLARLAGEAFTLITGADIEEHKLAAAAPKDDESGAADDPAADDAAPDPDENLAWPDASKVALWWQQNQPRFAVTTRYFVGEPVTVQHAQTVLRTGYQRQRILATCHIALLQPGTPLFDWQLPASWQRDQLG